MEKVQKWIYENKMTTIIITILLICFVIFALASIIHLKTTDFPVDKETMLKYQEEEKKLTSSMQKIYENGKIMFNDDDMVISSENIKNMEGGYDLIDTCTGYVEVKRVNEKIHFTSYITCEDGYTSKGYKAKKLD